jgi:hypothetical protein
MEDRMQTRRDSLSEFQHWQDRLWQEMTDRAEREETLQLEADVRAVEADPPDPILRDRLRAVGASDEDIAIFRFVLRREALAAGKTDPEARVVADETLTQYLDKQILDRSCF